MARIILEHKGQVLKDFPLHRGSLTIGRRNDNTIVLGDPQVSAYHARIDKRGSEYILTDLQSTNGTLVNNHKTFSHRLRHGDRISIRQYTLLFIGTEKEKIDAEASNVPLDRTVIIGAPRPKRTHFPTAPSPEQPVLQQPKASGFLRRMALVLLLVAVIVGIGLWRFNDDPAFLRGMLFKGKTVDKAEPRPLVAAKPEPLVPKPFTSDEALEASNRAPGLAIEAIVWSSDAANSFALINGTKVMVGQPIEEMTVYEIGRDYVLLRPHDGRSEVRLTLTLE